LATDPKAEVFRFVWLRQFHHPIAIRITVRPGGSGWIDSRETTGTRIMRYGRSWLTKGKTQGFLAALESAGFWKLPNLAGAGSAEWILEGVRDGHYYVVVRQSPDTADPVRGIGLLALKLARFRIRPNEI
jgi:hypothetical protein